MVAKGKMNKNKNEMHVKKMRLMTPKLFVFKYLSYSNIMPRFKNMCQTSLILPLCLYNIESLFRRAVL
jgi:hypothetical protein